MRRNKYSNTRGEVSLGAHTGRYVIGSGSYPLIEVTYKGETRCSQLGESEPKTIAQFLLIECINLHEKKGSDT